jgi:hypothetical protein
MQSPSLLFFDGVQLDSSATARPCEAAQRAEDTRQ